MIDHITLRVKDFKKSKKFYTGILAAFDIKLQKEKQDRSVSFGKDDRRSFFWIKKVDELNDIPSFGCLAFSAESISQVDDFYNNAIKFGAKCNGAPGVRKEYHDKYYAAYVVDPNGYNIEVVYHSDQNHFDDWCKIKRELDAQDEIERFYNVRDVWWSNFGKNIGFEEDGKDKDFVRPVVVIKALGPHTFLCAPLTTSDKEHYFRVDIGKVDGKPAKALISQIRVIDTRRLQEKIDRIPWSKLNAIKKVIKDML